MFSSVLAHSARSRNSSVGIVTKPQAGQDRNRGLNPGNAKDFSLLKNVETGCGAQGTSYSTGTGGVFPGSTAAVP